MAVLHDPHSVAANHVHRVPPRLLANDPVTLAAQAVSVHVLHGGRLALDANRGRLAQTLCPASSGLAGPPGAHNLEMGTVSETIREKKQFRK